MSNPFFDDPILNSPYAYPRRYWELDPQGQPTEQIVERRRPAEFITPIPKPKKRKTAESQQSLLLDEGEGLSSATQQYELTAMINQLRLRIDQWRMIPNPNHWGGNARDGATPPALASSQI